ncbi:MAG TPA: TetR/AcrR family transcriptional regulator [Solirubrobacteraceae bacterium]
MTERTQAPLDPSDRESTDRRDELLAAGLHLFSSQAYDELSIDAIAAEAGVAKGLLYYYFGSKRGFYVALIEQAARGMRERAATDLELPPRERLEHALDAHLSYAGEHSAGYRTLLAGGVGSDPEVRAILDRERATFLAMIVEGLGDDVKLTGALEIALYGWFGFVEDTTLRWLQRGGLERGEVLELLVESLRGVLTAAGVVDASLRGLDARLS